MSKKFFIPLILIFLISIEIALAQEYRINSVEYPKEIIVERGWTNYFSVVVKNTGDIELNNVTVYFDGESPEWFEVLTNKTNVLQISDNSSFMVKLSVPPDADPKSYSFILYSKSKEILSSKTFTVKVFKSKTDSMLYQVQKLELEIEYVKLNATKVENSGKNVTGVYNTLDEAKNYLETSKTYVNSGKYLEVTDLIINVENLIKKAVYDLSIAPAKLISTDGSYSFSYELLIAILLLSVFALSFYVVKTRRRSPVKPASNIKNVVLEQKKPTGLETELSEAENSKKLVEDEFKENLISKESYDELVEKYEKTISDLKQEIEKKKSVQ
jgi:hypothetical protein